ncbi:MAG: NUDIX hydrolase [Actinomycetota bacterium]|nr:NUDIX hydrolase [Actinomycetota bacterium]
MPAVAKDAASVMLLRDAPGSEGIEVLMVRRHARSDFAADVYVFPGGALEESDCGEDMVELCVGVGPGDAMSVIKDAPSPDRALGLYIAGIRETFEETGILLAWDATGEFVSCRGERAARFASLREDARKDRISFREMVAGEGLKLATDSLAYFAHWITPELSPIRYDTRFFLAPAPPCQDALHDDLEVTGHVWISPADALEQNEGGSFPMLPPTIINLMALARFPDVEEALRSPAGEEVAAILPRLSMEDGKLKLLLPDDPGYA